MKFIILVAIFIQNILANEILFTVDEEANIFVNQLNKNELLVLDRDGGKASLLNISLKTEMIKDMPVDPNCLGDQLPPFEFHYVAPYFLNADTTCLVDIKNQKVSFIGNIKTPKDHFSFAYLNKDEDNYYFLLNRRDYPLGLYGEIYVKTISIAEDKQSIELLIDHIPGLSGAMLADHANDAFYYTEASGAASNTLHHFKISQLMTIIKSSGVANFASTATKISPSFPGLSFKLFQFESRLFYYNATIYGTYDSFDLDLKTGKTSKLTIPEECHLIDINSAGIFTICDGRITRAD